jgi:vacuolar-type H+-ATPase subunit E/Vma4
MTTNQETGGVLREEILVDARKNGEEIIARARNEAETLLARAAAEADRVKQEQVDRARAEAARRTELILATVPVEAGRLRAGRIESLLSSVHEEACQRLLDRVGFDYREAIITLASHAIDRMEGAAFVVKLAEMDRDVLGDGLAEAIERRVGRPVNVAVSMEGGRSGDGVVVTDKESRQVWDNSLIKRLERLWPQMRHRVAVEAAFVRKTGSGGGAL